MQGEIRNFNFSAGAIKTSGAVRFNQTNVAQLKHELSGVSEYKVISVSYTWEPLVTPMSDTGMVGLVAGPTDAMLTALPSDIDSLLRAGMALKPASTRRTVQTGGSFDNFLLKTVSSGGVYVYVSKPGTADLGRVSGVATIRVRGVGSA